MDCLRFQTFREVATHGKDGYYKGRIAKEIVKVHDTTFTTGVGSTFDTWIPWGRCWVTWVA